jgi:ribosomal protein S18 acetylase RimI-like enzyme
MTASRVQTAIRYEGHLQGAHFIRATETVEIRAAAQSEEHAVVSTLVTAFSSDPAVRWTYPHPDQYLAHFRGLVRAFAGKAFAHDTAYVTPGYTGAALWLPPGIQPDEDEMETLLERTVSERVRSEVFAIFEKMGSYHPDEAHWYLPLMGVDGPHQGQGYGSALLRHALEACDRDQIPAYLESSNPRNISLYQRHGFELIGVIQLGSSPQICPMLRKPRRRAR